MATIVGCQFDGTLVSIDPATGSSTAIGPTGFALLNSMARDSSGTIYSTDGVNLVKIDPTTGVGTAVQTLKPTTDVRGLTFTPTDVLFAIRNGGEAGSTTDPDDLVTIDVTTGVVTLIGNTGFSALQAFECSPKGTLYGWDLIRGLVTIDPSTGAATVVNPGSGGSPDVQGLAFAPSGTLYGAGNALYTIDVSTGALTLVGSGGYKDVRGIEFLKEQRVHGPSIFRYAWLWMILVGGILITPIGPLCIVCGNPLPDVMVRVIGAITVVLAGLGLRHELSGPQSGR
jgi:hypothetical protein